MCNIQASAYGYCENPPELTTFIQSSLNRSVRSHTVTYSRSLSSKSTANYYEGLVQAQELFVDFCQCPDGELMVIHSAHADCNDIVCNGGIIRSSELNFCHRARNVPFGYSIAHCSQQNQYIDDKNADESVLIKDRELHLFDQNMDLDYKDIY